MSYRIGLWRPPYLNCARRVIKGGEIQQCTFSDSKKAHAVHDRNKTTIITVCTRRSFGVGDGIRNTTISGFRIPHSQSACLCGRYVKPPICDGVVGGFFLHCRRVFQYITSRKCADFVLAIWCHDISQAAHFRAAQLQCMSLRA